MHTRIAIVLALVAAPTAFSAAYTEIGDTGQLLGTAQNVGSGIDMIVGSIGVPGDVDLFAIEFDFTGTLQIDAVRDIDGDLDMNLHAFNAMGNPIGANDDGSLMGDTTLNSVLFLDITPGLFYFGVGDNNLEALDDMGNEIQDNDSGIEIPDGVLGGWDIDVEDVGGYTIVFSETSVPVPGTMGLLGLAGVLTTRRRRTT